MNGGTDDAADATVMNERLALLAVVEENPTNGLPMPAHDAALSTNSSLAARLRNRRRLLLLAPCVGLACALILCMLPRTKLVRALRLRVLADDEVGAAKPGPWLMCANAHDRCWDNTAAKSPPQQGPGPRLQRWKTNPATLAAQVGDLSTLPGIPPSAYGPVAQHWMAAPPFFAGKTIQLRHIAAFMAELLREDPFGTGATTIPYADLHAKFGTSNDEGGKVVAISQRQLAFVVANVLMGNDIETGNDLSAALVRCSGRSPNGGFVYSLLSLLAVLSQELQSGSHGSMLIAMTPQQIKSQRWKDLIFNHTLAPPTFCQRKHDLSWPLTVGSDKAEDAERFWNSSNGDGTFSLKASSGRFVTGYPQGNITAEHIAVKGWSSLTAEKHWDGTISIRSMTSKYFSADGDGFIRAYTDILGDSERLQRVQHDDGTISFKVAGGPKRGRFLTIGGTSAGDPKASWSCGERDFMAGGTPRQALTDIAGRVVGGGAMLCDVADSQDESLVQFYSEVLAFAFFAGSGQMLWVPFTLLGARRYLNYIGGETGAGFPYGSSCGALSARDWLNQEIPKTTEHVHIFDRHATVASSAFVAVASGTADPCDNKLAVNNLCPSQRQHLDADMALWYQAYEPTMYHGAVQGAFRQIVRRIGTGPWGAGAWWGDSQQSFLTVWLATSILGGRPALDYFIYDHFCENPANQCFLLGSEGCAACVVTGQVGYLGMVDPNRCGKQSVHKIVELFTGRPVAELYDAVWHAGAPPKQVFDLLAEQAPPEPGRSSAALGSGVVSVAT